MTHLKASLLRDKIASQPIVRGVGAGTALEARLIENAGFDFVWSSSLCVSAHFAVPDASLISMTQYLEAARAMNQAVSIPIIADCDTGYGNVNNVIYATRLFEEAGIAAISMEDKKFPKDNSLLAGGRQELATIEEFSGRIRAAKDVQFSDEFMVIARIEALIAGWGQEEAIRRAHSYTDSGADLILIHSKAKQPDEVLAFSQAWDRPTPLVIVPTTYPTLTENRIKRAGNIKVVIYANQPTRAAVKAIQGLLADIQKKEGIDDIEEWLVPVTRLFELQRVPEMKAQEKRYLP
jgi:phosphoenolpyruvate phosphomutase